MLFIVGVVIALVAVAGHPQNAGGRWRERRPSRLDERAMAGRTSRLAPTVRFQLGSQRGMRLTQRTHQRVRLEVRQNTRSPV